MRLIYTAAAILTGFVLLPALMLTGHQDWHPAMVLPTTLLSLSGASVLIALWVYPAALDAENWEDPVDLHTTLVHVAGFLGGYAAIFMVGVPLMAATISPAAFLGLPDELTVVEAIASFVAAALIVGHTWGPTLESAQHPEFARVRVRHDDH